MAQAGMLLSATEKIVVATGAANIYARDAVTTAAAQRTLDEAFPGRFLLGLGVSHPSLVEDVRGHRFGPPLATMRGYLDALDTAPFGPVSTVDAAPRMLAALGPGMLRLAGERAWGAHPLGMPVAHTRNARALLGPDALLAVTQVVVLAPAGVEVAREAAAQALPNRRPLLRELGFDDLDALSDELVDALVVHGTPDDVARRVEDHLDAGADHVSLHMLPADLAPWRELAGRLLG